MDGIDGPTLSGSSFDGPVFDSPKSRHLGRVGVVDVGSNSVRMVVFDGAARSPAYFYNEKIMCALGAGVAKTGHLNPEGRHRAIAAIRRFQLIAEGMGISPLSAVATAAVREATDGPDFVDEVHRETGLTLYVIDGPEEARLSAQGVLLGWPEAKGLVCDIGGSSMELACVAGGEVGARVTSALGPLRLQAIKGGRKGRRAHISKVLAGLGETVGTQHKRIYLVGGSWRAIARLDMERRGYPLHVLHEYRMSQKAARDTIKWIGKHTVQELRAMTGIGEARMALVPIASEVLRGLCATFHPKEIAISSYGIREGLLYEEMPEELRRRDPLIEACRFMEEKDARSPGFGKVLAAFIRPIFRNLREDRKRLVRAACHLHDVAWRAHPDYRHEICFDMVTRANLGGLAHNERVFLGLALLHRYRNSREGTHLEPLFALLNDKEILEAEILGKAMRFGAMLSVDAPEKMGELRWFPKKQVLELRLTPYAEGLFGEVTEARFNSLANSLGARTKVRVTQRARAPEAEG